MSIFACNTDLQLSGDADAALDENMWRAVCETVAAQANNGCGLSYEYYVDRFSSTIDSLVVRLPETQRAHALQIATQEWSYATPAERQEAQNWNAENGCCTHGIELGYCPAGCGSY
ncbi:MULTISPECIES: hypothetical protein [Gammaproteobacteria]|nr:MULTISPECIES: hypothetical protein [Gammaproteobacteria]CAD7714484.1 hypothetical protein LMG31884_11440 [Xanthomonas hydrangeae]PBP86109.1 hypothetical protein CCL22_02065 [Pseudomonas syringae]CAD7714485.1 hypothetical protein LMG31884_11440 [Xanthomonas hydrangeae]CAD7723959.1 hypothetical protein LMG31887_11440 [Xanthomonas hydrangeae]CAD7723963.1 hypothetical protein LMG31887_11440 [Xanthomonas hydrangeae]